MLWLAPLAQTNVIPGLPGDLAVGGASLRPRLFYFNTGFFTQKQVRRIVELAGYNLTLGKPASDDLIAVWGKSPTSGRGQNVGDLTGAQLVHIEDAFLRSIRTGRDGEPPIGLTIDRQRPYFDSSAPSDLETHLATASFDETSQMNEARQSIERIIALNTSKYNDFPVDAPVPAPGYVLVIDQTRGDASITHGSADASTFREMLAWAQEDHPGAQIVIKSHPESQTGHRDGHFSPDMLGPDMLLWDQPTSPYALMEAARAVYTVSSGMGFEAILAGHKPVVFGQPFYAGWGLTDDRQPIDRRQRKLSRAQLFAGCMMDYPKWYDPYLDELCDLERVLDTLEARANAHRADKQGYVALGMKPWKRRPLNDIFGAVSYVTDEAKAIEAARDKPLLIWANKMTDTLQMRARLAETRVLRVEDGFIRSRGLGADLIPPLSLVTDQTGIYYDATSSSDLERLISTASRLSAFDLERARKLRVAIVEGGISKYNLEGQSASLEPGERQVILVPGQVADDASIKFGTTVVRDNSTLLAQVRADFPGAYIVYKPHPDVEAGLRDGAIPASEADLIANDADPIALMAKAHRVATMTSLLGFEALMRGIPVSCYGQPFYAGWGLTDDRVAQSDRRREKVSLDALVHAALIDYPRYFDPVTRQACPPEVIVHRLQHNDIPAHPRGNRLMAKFQGWFAGFAPLWRS